MTQSAIRQIIERIDAGQTIGPEERLRFLETLQQYECWAPYFRLLKQITADSKIRTVDDYVRIARVQGLYLDDAAGAAATCAQIVKDLNVGFETIRDEVVPKVLEEEDFFAEAKIWEKCQEQFSLPADKVAALERLCLIYEKKTHNEATLGSAYEKLLRLDPHNIKALRYFKLAFTQNNEWAEVVEVLKTLLQSVKHPQEVFRYGQELAAVLLYQLERPDEAVKVLDKYCADSPLDTSTIHFDAYQRLGDTEGCLRVLRGCLLNVDDDSARSVLHFKIASILEYTGQHRLALENYEKAVKLSSLFLDPLEGMISMGIALKDWGVVKEGLNLLMARVEDDESRVQLNQARKRLENGLEKMPPIPNTNVNVPKPPL